MGSVVKFPDQRPGAQDGRYALSDSATVIILPVVRVERHDDGPTSDADQPGSGRRRRPRATR